jgi:hypothetical protein
MLCIVWELLHGLLLLGLELLLLKLLDSGLVHDNLCWIESDFLNKVQLDIAHHLSEQVNERFFKLVIRLG